MFLCEFTWRNLLRMLMLKVTYMLSRFEVGCHFWLRSAPHLRASPIDPDNTDTIAIKVGRATSLNKRIDQWSKQCSSKEQILRGWWPGGVSNNTRLLKGTVEPGLRGKYCHRLERLIHLELADISQNAQYLEREFPDVTVPDKQLKKADDRCKDCKCSLLLGVRRTS